MTIIDKVDYIKIEPGWAVVSCIDLHNFVKNQKTPDHVTQINDDYFPLY